MFYLVSSTKERTTSSLLDSLFSFVLLRQKVGLLICFYKRTSASVSTFNITRIYMACSSALHCKESQFLNDIYLPRTVIKRKIFILKIHLGQRQKKKKKGRPN